MDAGHGAAGSSRCGRALEWLSPVEHVIYGYRTGVGMRRGVYLINGAGLAGMQRGGGYADVRHACQLHGSGHA
jgi:hypothetical protein